MAIDTNEARLYGVGQGSAFVWGQNKALAGLQAEYQRDQLRRQKEDVEIAEDVAKINYDAARNEDLPEILKRYQDIKNTFTKIRGTNNQMERIKLQSELNQKKAELTRGVNLSKQAAQQLGELGKLRLTHADDISDEFTPNYRTLNKLSVFDPKFNELAERTGSTALLPKFDQISLSKKLADASVKKMSESGVKSEKIGDGTSYYTESGQKLDKEALLNNVAMETGRNRGLQNQIKKLYPNVPFTDAVKAYSDDLYESMKGSYDEVKRSGASVVKPDNWKEKALFNDALIRSRSTLDSDGIGVAQPITIPYGSGVNKGNVEMDQYVPVSLSKKNFAGSEYIDLKTGKPAGKLNSSNDYEIVGVGNAPFIKSGNFKGAISQPNFANQNPDAIERRPIVHVQVPATSESPAKDYFVPYDRLPENVKNSKQVRDVLIKFTPAKVTTKSTTSKKKTIKGW